MPYEGERGSGIFLILQAVFGKNVQVEGRATLSPRSQEIGPNISSFSSIKIVSFRNFS